MAKGRLDHLGLRRRLRPGDSPTRSYGVPLQYLVDKFSHSGSSVGMTKNPEVRFAKSIVDYIFRWMAVKFLSEEASPRRRQPAEAVRRRAGAAQLPLDGMPSGGTDGPRASSAKVRRDLGRGRAAVFTADRSWSGAGSCYKCVNCGSTSGSRKQRNEHRTTHERSGTDTERTRKRARTIRSAERFPYCRWVRASPDKEQDDGPGGDHPARRVSTSAPTRAASTSSSAEQSARDLSRTATSP